MAASSSIPRRRRSSYRPVRLLRNSLRLASFGLNLGAGSGSDSGHEREMDRDPGGFGGQKGKVQSDLASQTTTNCRRGRLGGGAALAATPPTRQLPDDLSPAADRSPGQNWPPTWTIQRAEDCLHQRRAPAGQPFAQIDHLAPSLNSLPTASAAAADSINCPAHWRAHRCAKIQPNGFIRHRPPGLIFGLLVGRLIWRPLAGRGP